MTEGGPMDGPRDATRRLRRLVTRHPRLAAVTGSGMAVIAAVAVTLAFTLAGHAAPARPVAAPLRPHPHVTQVRRVTRKPPKGPLLDPFTGEPVKALGPVLAVKIDN